MIDKGVLKRIYTEFKICAPLFIALGDEIRQQLVLDIADAYDEGINVTNLAAKSHLSRPAISHHLKVLKDCGIIIPCKKGTQIFYQMNLQKNIGDIKKLIDSIEYILNTENSSSC